MKNTFLIFFFPLIVISGRAQVVTLEPTNPAPRVGEEVTLSFRIESEESAGEKENEIVAKYFGRQNTIGQGEFKLNSRVLQEMGPVPLGPFQFTIDNKVYTSNQIILNVHGKLPDDILDGIWIRMVTFDTVNYIVMEQRAAATETHSKDADGSSWTVSTPDIDWAVINGEKLRQTGIYLQQKRSSSSIQLLGNGRSVAYKITVYTYEIGKSFKGKFKIERDGINHFPPKGHFEAR